jgi:hypothetical protein
MYTPHLSSGSVPRPDASPRAKRRKAEKQLFLCFLCFLCVRPDLLLFRGSFNQRSSRS